MWSRVIRLVARLDPAALRTVRDEAGQAWKILGLALRSESGVLGGKARAIGSEDEDSRCRGPRARSQVDRRHVAPEVGRKVKPPTDSTPGGFGSGEPSGTVRMRHSLSAMSCRAFRLVATGAGRTSQSTLASLAADRFEGGVPPGHRPLGMLLPRTVEGQAGAGGAAERTPQVAQGSMREMLRRTPISAICRIAHEVGDFCLGQSKPVAGNMG